MRRSTLALLLLAIPGVAAAQADEPAEPAPQIIYQDKTFIDFRELQVDGVLTGPPISYSREIQIKNLPPMFHLRGDFNTEMSESVNEIR